MTLTSQRKQDSTQKEYIISAIMLMLVLTTAIAGPCLVINQSRIINYLEERKHETDEAYLLPVATTVEPHAFNSIISAEQTKLIAVEETSPFESSYRTALRAESATGTMDAEPMFSTSAVSVCADAAPREDQELNIETAETGPSYELRTGAEKKPALRDYEVPSAESGFKAWMDYRCITAKSSIQYKLQQSAETDDMGFRRYIGEDGKRYYMIALGTYYTGYRCGKTFRITLESGESFEAITGDVKADIHTDAKNQHRRGNVVEFIVDTRQISKNCSIMGDMSYADEHFVGHIAKIEGI